MKKSHIAALILIGIAIAVLISSMVNVTAYETIASAKQKSGKTVTVIAKLDKATVQYNPAVNPNYLTFEAIDTLGDRMKVAYYYEKPYDMEKSERIVLKGKMENGVFQIHDQKGILIKCPSKYKDDPEAAKKAINQQAMK
ncbi:cytochrome c maturation protein CcmE [Ilyomonas limi]|uniref:Cytochrome c maturation protein CcmE n=1 Tax=Ilyomonas limi TaxID=2575867 RepID=A0A4U3L1Z5_9BACT|nr:cytochrome c maturation protein CcmE [Ilyomonas limi]TKK69028.1 cytochrome c maturation protein CcmE [Ilyomonas limi]